MCKKIEKYKQLFAQEEGTTVVELAVIVPLIWILIMWCIFFFFFFLDMGALRSEGYARANEVVRTWEAEENVSLDTIEHTLRKNLKNKFILAKLQKESITVSFGTVYVKTEIGFEIAGHTFSFTHCAKAALNNRENWVRTLLHGN